MIYSYLLPTVGLSTDPKAIPARMTILCFTKSYPRLRSRNSLLRKFLPRTKYCFLDDLLDTFLIFTSFLLLLQCIFREGGLQDLHVFFPGSGSLYLKVSWSQPRFVAELHCMMHVSGPQPCLTPLQSFQRIVVTNIKAATVCV